MRMSGILAHGRTAMVRAALASVALGTGAAAVAAALAAGCEPTARDPRPVILYGSDNQGVLAACGCPSNPTGGLAKRQGLIEQYRRTREHVLVVDAGNVMPDRDNPVKVKYLGRALGRAKYDAIALGDQEFRLGADRLRALAREYGLPLVCANVRDAAGDLVGAANVVSEINGFRLGIFSVIADRAWGFPVREWRTGLKVEPPAEAARGQVAELDGCDLVVALLHMTMLEARDMLPDVPGIDVAIVGHDPEVLRKPLVVGGTMVLSPGEAGRLLGSVTVERREPGGQPELVPELTVLSAQVPDAGWVMDMYWEYVKESKEKPPPDWDLTPIPPRYETAEACKECHEDEYNQWLTTKHARAYEPIKKAGRHEDPECILCHTMGLGRKGGFMSMAKTPGLGRVTCQACHPVTSDHEEKGVKIDSEISISSRLCMSCHGPVQSPDFDYFVYKPKILHTSGPEKRTVE